MSTLNLFTTSSSFSNFYFFSVTFLASFFANSGSLYCSALFSSLSYFFSFFFISLSLLSFFYFWSFVRKYSPLSICLSSLLKGYGLGNVFLSLGNFFIFFFFCTGFEDFSNFCRNLSQFSFYIFGSFSNSFLIINSLMY